MSIRVEGKQKRAFVTRQKILQAYEGLVENKQFDDVSIAEIAKAAGVGKGTVLAHFSEKLALPATLFAVKLDEICEEIDRISASEFDIVEAVMPLLDFSFNDDVYARIMLWEGHAICEEIIGLSEVKLFEVLSKKWAKTDRMSDETQFELLRALLVNAVVMHRTCQSATETRTQFKKLMRATIGSG